MMELLWLLLPVAAASGWWAAKRSCAEGKPGAADRTPAYFKGLNYLLNEQPDKAIDVFVKMLEVDSDTVETHLALGNLFRRRGEVDRAIRIHQNLIARPTLNRDQRAQALLELGQDYMRAGLFDRAESLFKELDEMKMYQEQALDNLGVIYQQEKDWEQCLAVARKLEEFSGKSLRRERAHYFCELAEESLAKKDSNSARAYLKKAHSSDPQCVRATILQGQMDAASGNHKSAIRILKQVERQDPRLLSEILPTLTECYRKEGSRRELIAYLHELFERYRDISVAMALVGFIQEDEGDAAATRFVTAYLDQHPSLEGLKRLLSLSLRRSGIEESDTLRILQRYVEKLLLSRPAYQCSRCGFSAKTMHWQCPGCKSWSSIKPHQEFDDAKAESGKL
jgi:lipopolysaccharide biosynthesis regulator YciM